MTDSSSTPEAQTPTPTSASAADAGEVSAQTPEQVHATGDSETSAQGESTGEAETPEQAESPEDADPEEVPSDEELEEPSIAKDPGEQPKAPSTDEPKPDHEAVGIGVIGGPQVDPEAVSDD
ncbi:hypothetical protein [Microbacterium sp.]|uniref:hypothetical protein n=1 Tax=Microbacterium sp. TaxID=51671 RepID=UPI002811493E|nr:hypothetical protein [Microbacterium sp.]